MIAPPKIKEYDDAALGKELTAALRTMRVKDAAAHVAEITGVSKSILYQMALDINDKNKE